MHYKVAGLVVKTENAAKPASQACRWVLRWIDDLSKESVALDYGCGKFRYTIPLAKRVSKVYAVDSEVQVKRLQLVDGERTTLKQYAQTRLPKVEVYEVDERGWRRKKYDRILLANVLSTIPVIRRRVDMLSMLRDLLRQDGQLLACTQFRNSYFKTYETNPRAHQRRGGWLVQLGSDSASYYAIVPLKRLERLCFQAKLRVVHAYVRGESAYVVCGR